MLLQPHHYFYLVWWLNFTSPDLCVFFLAQFFPCPVVNSVNLKFHVFLIFLNFKTVGIGLLYYCTDIIFFGHVCRFFITFASASVMSDKDAAGEGIVSDARNALRPWVLQHVKLHLHSPSVLIGSRAPNFPLWPFCPPPLSGLFSVHWIPSSTMGPVTIGRLLPHFGLNIGRDWGRGWCSLLLCYSLFPCPCILVLGACAWGPRRRWVEGRIRLSVGGSNRVGVVFVNLTADPRSVLFSLSKAPVLDSPPERCGGLISAHPWCFLDRICEQE